VLTPAFAGCGEEDRAMGAGHEEVGTSSEALTAVCGAKSTDPVQGHDVSVYQGAFNWAQAKANGRSFGYARISYGTGVIDSTFDGNWARMKAAGILRGGYQFFLPAQDIAAQAKIVIDKVGKLGVGDLPVAIDVEDVQGLAPATAAARIHQWLDLVEAGTGKRPIIYTGAYFWQDHVGATDFGNYKLWIANYNPGCPLVPNGWTNWTIWQYGDGNATLDHDVFNGTAADLAAFAGSSSEDYPTLPRRSATDINGDGKADACARAIRGVICNVSKGDGFLEEIAGPKWNDATGWNKPEYRETIQFGDIDGDGKADICGRGPNGIVCNISDGNGFPTEIKGPEWTDGAGFANAQFYKTIQLADVNGDGKLDICARGVAGIGCNLSDGRGFPKGISGPEWSDAKGWSKAEYYATIQFADIDGDGKADICARAAAGIVCHLSDGKGFPTEVKGPAWTDASGWSRAQHGSTIRFVDIDGDGRADVCGRAAAGIVCARSNGTSFGEELPGPAWSNANGWSDPAAYETIQWADINGDKKADVCGRSATGMVCNLSDGRAFTVEVKGPAFTDAAGWNKPPYYTTIAAGDVNNDGKDDLCGRSPTGLVCALSSGNAFGDLINGPTWADSTGWGATTYYSSLRLIGYAPLAKASGVPPGPGSGPGSSSGGPGGSSGEGSGGEAGSGDDDSGCAVGTTRTRTSGVAFLGGLAIAAVALGRRRRRR
jgi:GH25 family lysozyme M1 (1,4-beta-N-acetylmuramidase)